MLRRVFLGCAAIFLAGACGPAETEVATETPQAVAEPASPVAGGTLVLGLQQEPDVLNPILSRMRVTNYVSQMIFSYFARMDEHYDLIPDLLTEIPTRENGGVSADGLTITYRLRPDVVWHDGEPLTAADARFTYELITDPEIAVATAHGWEIVESVETPDATTVVFHLKEPSPSFVADAFVDEPVLPRHLLAGVPAAEFRSLPYQRAPVGSGPFRLESWESASELVLSRFDAYHGEGPYLDRLILRVVPDAEARIVQLTTGELHGFDNARTIMAERLSSVRGITLHRTPGTVYEHLDMNCERPPLDDVRVRQAITRAIDRAEISGAVYDQLWPPAYSDNPPGSPLDDRSQAERVRSDLSEAERLLEEAGWSSFAADGVRTRNGERLDLNLILPAGRPDRESVGVLLAAQLARVGVGVQIQPLEPTVFFSSAAKGGPLQSGDFDLALFAWSAPPDPSVKELLYGQDFVPPGGQNVTRLRDPDLSRLLRQASRELDPERRLSLFLEADRRRADLVPSVPLVWRTQLDPVTDRLQNFRPNPTISGNSWNASTWWLRPAT
jgi:peptide/nickel transport system substrate-binding protein